MDDGFSLEVIDEIYSKKSVFDAREAFSSYLTLQITPLGRGRSKLFIKIKPKYLENSREVLLEFMNYMLDRSVQLLLEK